MEGELLDGPVECRRRRIHRAWHVTVAVFGRAAYVDDLQLAIRDPILQLVHAELLDGVKRESGLAPTLNAATQITFHIFDAHARQTNHRFVNLVPCIGDDHDCSVQGNQTTGPDRELSAESDVHRTRNMIRAKLCRRTYVKQHVTARL